MTSSLQGKRAIITGSGAGIGEASAHIFAERGASVVVADISKKNAERVAGDITRRGFVALPFVADVGDEAQVKELIDFTVGELAGIDVLFCNAAHVAAEVMARDKLISDVDTTLFAEILRVNVMGPMLGVKHAAPHMVRNRGGVILVTSSLSGSLGQFRESMYGTSKSALTGMIPYITTQYGRYGIRAVGIAPGCMISEQDAIEKGLESYLPTLRRHTPFTRLGRPEDIGNVAAFLSSDDAAYISGITILVDGGFSSHFASYADDLASFTEEQHPSSS